MLACQGQIHEIAGGGARLAAVARSYTKQPEGTLVISPDNKSRHEMNERIHCALQEKGVVSKEEHRVKVLINRNDLTGADRRWSGRYELGDVVRYGRGSKQHGLVQAECAAVVAKDTEANLLTVRKQNGRCVTYDPKRLCGVSVYRWEDRLFAAGSRLQFTAPGTLSGERVANRQLATVEALDDHGGVRLRLDSGWRIEFNLRDYPHVDHGYAMTSHSCQSETVNRAIFHATARDGESRELVNKRLAYTAWSRARNEVEVYTNDVGMLAKKLSREVSKEVALEGRAAELGAKLSREQSKTVAVEHGMAMEV